MFSYSIFIGYLCFSTIIDNLLAIYIDIKETTIQQILVYYVNNISSNATEI